ncbi:hypothetical protein EBB79_13145 [Parasedimentitalea marina]|uniref:Uncharacterized protein n=1 Tax=Parasedimentitalea marina TaxID=2483033 RepID=A0A3T0N406_9RHOB|nr:hypothetical protein EBB79_13145 [Parasedimentitalea marina]
MIGIICNLMIPGLGSLLMKKFFNSFIQLTLSLAAFILVRTVFLAFFGLILWLIVWLWALVTGLQHRKRCKITQRSNAV